MNHVPSSLASGNPHFMMAMEALKMTQNVVISQKLDQVIGLVKNVQILSYVNIAMTGVNLGVSIAGFAIVMSQLNQCNQKLDFITNQLEDLKKAEIKNLLREAIFSMNNSTSLVEMLNSIPVSQYIEYETEKQLNHLECLINDLLSRLNDKINLSLSIIQGLYTNYTNLFKAYLTSQYLSKKNINSTHLLRRLDFIKKTYNELTKKEIINDIYEDCLLNLEQRLSESELSSILFLYEYGCQQTLDYAKNHVEILLTTPIKKFQTWKKSSSSTSESLIWILH